MNTREMYPQRRNFKERSSIRERLWIKRLGSLEAPGECCYCGVPLAFPGIWHADHVHPVIQGGTDRFDNLVIACRRCNIGKGGRTPEQYREGVERRWTKRLEDALEAIEQIASYARARNLEDPTCWEVREVADVGHHLEDLLAFVREGSLVRFHYERPWSRRGRES
jgi:hypothetical protein